MKKIYNRNFIVVILFIGLCAFVPNSEYFANMIAAGKSTQIQPNTIVKIASVDQVKEKTNEVKSDDSICTTTVDESVEAANIQSTIDKNSINISSNNSSTKSSPKIVDTSKDDSNSTNASNSNGSTSNQVSRGKSAVDTSKYPLLSKVNGSFGQFRYRDLSGGRIEVDPQWVAENIVTITLPGLNRQVQVHKDAADNFITAFNYIKNGTAIINGQEVLLLSLIKTMDGTYVTRHVNWNPERGLSNHSWGTAIDINADGHFGYVDANSDPVDPNLILWEKAFQPAGFNWGNRYGDSMHFELIK